MFRELRRKKNAISMEETIQLLINEKRGVLSVNGENGYPYAIPVGFYYDQEVNKIYFHGSKVGYKVDCLKNDDKICFTVYGNEMYKEDWAPYLKSAIIFGKCHLIHDFDTTVKHVYKLAQKYYPNEEEIEKEIQKDIKGVQLYEITIEHICGKQIHER